MQHGWRIASPEFSVNQSQMLSGEGAFLHGGRWNSKGVRIVYLGSSLAQAAMELLVHLRGLDALKHFRVMRVSFEEHLMEHIDLFDLPSNWQAPAMESSVKAVGDEWVASASSLILQVPSAAISGEYNFLLNPGHPDAIKLELGPITPFRFDPRVLK